MLKIEREFRDETIAYRATFSTEKSWKDEANRIEVYTQGGCKVWFEEGKRYLVYAVKNADSLETNLCMRTGLVEYSKADLKKLGEPKPKKKNE